MVKATGREERAARQHCLNMRMDPDERAVVVGPGGAPEQVIKWQAVVGEMRNARSTVEALRDAYGAPAASAEGTSGAVKLGDVVRLRSGGRLMTVLKVEGEVATLVYDTGDPNNLPITSLPVTVVRVVVGDD